jgi:hypothetical protein
MVWIFIQNYYKGLYTVYEIDKIKYTEIWK